MLIFLSKFLPLFVYPLGLGVLFILLALFLARRARWQKTVLILALLVLWLASTHWVSMAITRSLEWQYLPPSPVPSAEAIVVLGGGTSSADYPRQTVELSSAGSRVFYAAWLYKQGKAPFILVSGGNIDWLNSGNSPAKDMAEILEFMGVPKEAIWLEPDSRNTYENALYSRKILEQKGIHRVLLVTSAVHMPRSVGLFRRQGIDVIPAPADFSVTQTEWSQLTQANIPAQILNLLPNVDDLASVSRAMKEYIGILYSRLSGWM